MRLRAEVPLVSHREERARNLCLAGYLIIFSKDKNTMKDLAPLVAKATRGRAGRRKKNKINLVISVQEKKKKQRMRMTYKTKKSYVRERHITSFH